MKIELQLNELVKFYYKSVENYYLSVWMLTEDNQWIIFYFGN